MSDTDRDPTTDMLDRPRAVSDLPAPRETAPGDAAPSDTGPSDPAPSQGSTGAADHVPPDAVGEVSTRTGSSVKPSANPNELAEGDPGDLPRDDVPPVGSIVPDDLPSEDVNVPDPDGPDETVDTDIGHAAQLRTSGL